MNLGSDIILVDSQDNAVGVGEKWDVHQRGLLHRAFSVLLFNAWGEMLLHQRAHGKYHCPGLWTNTCCSHPKPGESIQQAAQRRMQEELGLAVPVSWQLRFEYRAEMPNGLIEHEMDHVLIGHLENTPQNANTEEIQAFRWASLDIVRQEITVDPEAFTPWFPMILERLRAGAGRPVQLEG